MNGSGYQRRTSYRLLLMILWAMLLVFVVELTAGWIAHSLCLLAESLHTLIDIFSTLLGLIAVSSPQRPLGREIWGHGRGEAAGALILSAILGFSGVSLTIVALSQLAALFQTASLQAASLQTVQSAFQVGITPSLVGLMGVMVALMLAVVLVAAQRSKTLNSLALKLNTQHILSDAWLSVLLLAGLVVISRGQPWLDPLLAFGIVILAVKSLWQMLHRQLPMLLKPTAIAPEAIAQIACQVEGVTRCTRILSRGMVGRQVWIELHLVIHPEYMVIAHSLGERVERSLREHYGPVCAQIWLNQTKQSNAIDLQPPSAPNT
jgi:cation diffusion facilitator family transporter